jgi:hypothetical protein
MDDTQEPFPQCKNGCVTNTPKKKEEKPENQQKEKNLVEKVVTIPLNMYVAMEEVPLLWVLKQIIDAYLTVCEHFGCAQSGRIVHELRGPFFLADNDFYYADYYNNVCLDHLLTCSFARSHEVGWVLCDRTCSVEQLMDSDHIEQVDGLCQWYCYRCWEYNSYTQCGPGDRLS